MTRARENWSIHNKRHPAAPGSPFGGTHGAPLLIDAATLVRMYELVRFDLERRGGWADLMARMESDPVTVEHST